MTIDPCVHGADPSTCFLCCVPVINAMPAQGFDTGEMWRKVGADNERARIVAVLRQFIGCKCGHPVPGRHFSMCFAWVIDEIEPGESPTPTGEDEG